MVLTHRAVWPHPAGVTAADAGVGEDRTVAMALVGAECAGQLAVGAPPAWLAVTIAVDTDSVTRAGGVQAVHCGNTHTCTFLCL